MRERPQLRDVSPRTRGRSCARATARYDAIFVDAYHQPYIPFYLATSEFFELARDRLAPGGVVIVNVGHPEGSDKLEKVLSATMRRRVPVRRCATRSRTSTRCSSRPTTEPRRENLRAVAPELPADLRPLAFATAARLEPALEGGDVYTDDHAPVEWLIDASIVEEATGGAGD